MTDVDLFHDRLLNESSRRNFVARMDGDPALREDLEFRRALDDRLCSAFRVPPDQVDAVVATPSRTWFGRAPWMLLAAAVFLIASFAWSDRDPGMDAAVLWRELTPVFGCDVGVVDNDGFARHCLARHGAALHVKIPQGVIVHGPTDCASMPNASVWTVILPPAVPFGPVEMRAVLVGVPRSIRAAEGVRFFEAEVGGLRVVELTTDSKSRVLPWLRSGQ